MPSSRRRRFNAQNNIVNNIVKPETQNETHINHLDPEPNIPISQNMLLGNNTKPKSKAYPNISQKPFMLDNNSFSQYKRTTATETTIEDNIIRNDKEVDASSSNIDLFTKLNSSDLTINGNKNNKMERNSIRDKRTHRVQVRSPKRKCVMVEKNVCKKNSIGIDAIDWGDSVLVKGSNNIEVQVNKEEIQLEEHIVEERVSNHSTEDMCRICHSGESTTTELGSMISACECRGTVGRVHVKCLERWLTESGKSRCELCGTKYVTKRVHKYGVLKALALWILSNNSKNMIVDFFGIMIMTPIAVVAAGLTGKTFAGLMAQDQITPWPLASTFVLACMTLVCYYCWIVSALTRHALGWWIWYRSHYEVRLQLQEDTITGLDIEPNILT